MTYYTVSQAPTRNTLGRAAPIADELQAIADGFAKLPEEAPLKRGRVWYAASVGGTANAITLTMSLTMTTPYVAGDIAFFLPGADNTGAATVNVDGIGAVAIVQPDGSPLAAGNIQSGAVTLIAYNGSTWNLVGGYTSTDQATLAAIVDDIEAVAAIAANVTTVAGVAASVTTVAGISGNVTTVAGISGNVTTVAGVSAAVSTVSGIAANVTTVAGISGNVTTVAGIAAAVSAVAAIDTDVTAVAAVDDDVVAVAAWLAGATPGPEITGPGLTTDNAIMLWDGPAGGAAKDSGVTLASLNNQARVWAAVWGS
jgi:hypothetical protein